MVEVIFLVSHDDQRMISIPKVLKLASKNNFRFQTRPKTLKPGIVNPDYNLALSYVLNDALQVMTSCENG
jgi:hypothetical protein